MSIIERYPSSYDTDAAKVDELPIEEFRLVLPESQLIDPITNRGEVVELKEVLPIDEYGKQLPDGVKLHEVRIRDPFIDADPKTYWGVNRYLRKIESVSETAGLNFMERNEALTEDERNRYTRAWVAHPSVHSSSIWRGLVPSAEALHFLTNPYVGVDIADRNGNKDIISPETAAQLRFTEDGIGIRDRGVAMAHLLAEHLLSTNDSKPELLSLASGTAEPTLAAARKGIDETGKTPKLTVVDFDRRSLKFVKNNAERYGLTGSVTTIAGNILSPDIKDKLALDTGIDQWDVVENMGFEEYLPEEGDEMGAFKGAELPAASNFTKTAFDLVKPGGVLISGNMVFERPQRTFVFGIVDWPLINARSEQQILRVYERAGILGNPKAKIEMFRVINDQTGTHIYNIVRVQKVV